MSNLSQAGTEVRHIHVMAGVMRRPDGMVLVAQRPAGKSMAGAWEFPGGKLEEGEQRLPGLRRELVEELGIELASARPLIRYLHRYPGFTLDLDAWLVHEWSGEAHGMEGQELAWRPVEDLMAMGLLRADAAVVDALSLPSLVGITPSHMFDENRLLDAVEISALHGPAELLVLRRPALPADQLIELAAGVACRLEGSMSPLVLHGDPGILLPVIHDRLAAQAPHLNGIVAGLHVPSRFLGRMSARPISQDLLFGVSCHDESELAAAVALGADYAFLGPVKETASHPGQPGMGWQKFEELVRDLPLPVYAIGGLGPDDLETAWAHGAQGIAAIRSLWPKD